MYTFLYTQWINRLLYILRALR